MYAQQGKTSSAAELYEEIISLQPNATRAYASLAALYPNDQTKRQDIYQRGVSANPKDPALNLFLATEYERSGQFETAIEAYENLLTDDANNIIAINNLAALMLDYRADAESHARALELAKRFETSDQAALLDTLGWAYYHNGDYENAVRLLEAAVAASDQIALLHYHLGMALVKMNKPGLGRDELNKSLSMAEEDFPGIEEARATLKQL